MTKSSQAAPDSLLDPSSDFFRLPIFVFLPNVWTGRNITSRNQELRRSAGKMPGFASGMISRQCKPSWWPHLAPKFTCPALFPLGKSSLQYFQDVRGPHASFGKPSHAERNRKTDALGRKSSVPNEPAEGSRKTGLFRRSKLVLCCL